jgi:hypothetical protein
MGKLLAALALLAACRAAPPAAEPRRYAVRGEIAALPVARQPGTELMVRHEPIDDFADRTGKVVGMDSMVMPFRLEPPLSAEGLAVGDKVLLRFSMDWERPALRVVAIERLPPGTELRFGPARPPAPPR